MKGGRDSGKQDHWRHTVTAGRRLRRGYSTGTCAAAAAGAAALLLFEGSVPEEVGITLPGGLRLVLPVLEAERGESWARCAVRKDAGDDPDITGGVLVFARVSTGREPGISLVAGEGVGRVTKPGLQVPVGRPAINPVPEKMIRNAVSPGLPPGRGVVVEISIPGGEELARKTLNARLGVEGGLSILGTSGLVEPLSTRAYEETLALEIAAAAAEHGSPLVLVTGNLGRQLALEHFRLLPGRVIKIGNLVGYALDRCHEHNLGRVLLVGHLGKLIKVAAGIFNTHSRVADARFETFAARAALLGAGRSEILRLQGAATSEEMAEVLAALGGDDYFASLCAEISTRATEYLHGGITVGTVLFNFRRGLLGSDERARLILEELGSA